MGVSSLIGGYAGRHRAARRLPLARFAVVAVVGSFCFGLGSAMPVQSAPAVLAPEASVVHATLASSTESLGGRMLDQARTRTGDWYFYGATGPSAFDCSGLVYWSAGQLGLKNFPRDTYDLLASVSSGRLVRTYSPQRGDLAFYGSGHVEFVTAWYHQTFGAQTWGTRVGWHKWSGWWQPTAFYRIRW
jgi:hypothetical protein